MISKGDRIAFYLATFCTYLVFFGAWVGLLYGIKTMYVPYINWTQILLVAFMASILLFHRDLGQITEMYNELKIKKE